jgi:hypothetical protein
MVGVALAYTMWFGKWMKSTNLNKILINKSKKLVFLLGEQNKHSMNLKIKSLLSA